MKVLKFGGTSLGSIESLSQVKDILEKKNEEIIVVCSAMSGVTNQLVSIVEDVKNNNTIRIKEYLYNLEGKHIDVIHSLIVDNEVKEKLKKEISNMIKEISELTKQQYSESLKSKIITYGEALLTQIFSEYLNVSGVPNTLLKAKDFMLVDSIDKPNIEKVSDTLKSVLEHLPKSEVYITQGFICRDENGIITDLKRGGSDYSATIIGAAIDAEEIEIWTDIDGLHNNDPRYVNNTESVPYLSYAEASKLAHFGAKILHPKTVLPLAGKDIPVILKNTFMPSKTGTVISSDAYTKGVKAISGKDKITIVKIEPKVALGGHGFLKEIFEIFDKHKTSIGVVITSEESISLTIDDTSNLVEIVNEIEVHAEVNIDSLNTIICIVGNSIIDDEKTHKIFDILKHIPVKMISLGKNDNNVSVVIDTESKVEALKYLQEKLFLQEKAFA
ncbi:aspartate kinase [Tenacibaculum halocynthiae]|uniref:aspartate kinase n=1 Tax=Tenacibaculum halocynthiae TaxID=1254437 RepID=UPI003893BC21